MMYHYRGPVIDSGGPGKYRGGVNHEFAFSAHDTGLGHIGLGLTSKGLRVPMSLGIFGGLPGCMVQQKLFRGANVDSLPGSIAETTGERTEHVQWGDYELAENDIIYIRFQGGGGYGDPIDREPARTLHDVTIGTVSVAAAHDVYGVELDAAQKQVDEKATRTRRAAIRDARVGRSVPSTYWERQAVAASGQPLGEYLQQVGDHDTGFVQCTWCGGRLAGSGEHWKDHVEQQSSPTRDGGEAEGLVLRQFFCPQCATLLDTEVVLEKDPPLYDHIRLWAATTTTGQRP